MSLLNFIHIDTALLSQSFPLYCFLPHLLFMLLLLNQPFTICAFLFTQNPLPFFPTLHGVPFSPETSKIYVLIGSHASSRHTRCGSDEHRLLGCLEAFIVISIVLLLRKSWLREIVLTSAATEG